MATHNSLEHLHNAFIYLSQIGWQDDVTKGYTVQCFRDMHTIHYVKKGSTFLETANHTYEIKSGEAFYIPPCQLAQYGAISEEPCEYYYFAFAGSYADEVIRDTVFKNGNYVSEIKDAEKLVKIIEEASELIKVRPYPQYYGLEQLFKLLPFITQTSSTKFSKAKMKYFAICKEYIHAHYNENLKIEDIAKALNVSANYVFRIFKECSNMSPHDYLTSVRMQHAKQYLIDTDLSINEIAVMVGYVNYTTFYSMFNSKMYMSPHEYRLLQRNSNSEVEGNSATTIRIFRDMEDCLDMERFAIKKLTEKDDAHFLQCKIKDFYLRKLNYKNAEYDCFAYIFEDSKDARRYFENVSGTNSRNQDFDFKIRDTSDSTVLCVWHNNHAYKWQGGNLLEFNDFRHTMNRFYHTILLN